jgi:putative oxidoreductase
MTTIEGIGTRVEQTFRALQRFEWIPLLLTRLFIGYFFAETGWGKIHNLDAMTQRFIEWGIPLPAFNAALSGYMEFCGGVLVLIGFGTRFIAVPMAFNMVVATVAVKLKAVTDLNGFVELDEPLYGLVFLWMVFSGPGVVSVDGLIARWWARRAAVTARRE